jgi:hypothetical protein
MYCYMSTIFSKRLLLLIVCVGLIFLFPEVKTIPQLEISSSLAANLPQTTGLRLEYITPQKLQQQQAVRQRRNLEIQKVLDLGQQEDLRKLVHRGDDFNQAIAKLKISAQQREILKTIHQLYGLKLEAIK